MGRESQVLIMFNVKHSWVVCSKSKSLGPLPFGKKDKRRTNGGLPAPLSVEKWTLLHLTIKFWSSSPSFGMTITKGLKTHFYSTQLNALHSFSVQRSRFFSHCIFVLRAQGEIIRLKYDKYWIGSIITDFMQFWMELVSPDTQGIDIALVTSLLS